MRAATVSRCRPRGPGSVAIPHAQRLSLLPGPVGDAAVWGAWPPRALRWCSGTSEPAASTDGGGGHGPAAKQGEAEDRPTGPTSEGARFLQRAASWRNAQRKLAGTHKEGDSQAGGSPQQQASLDEQLDPTHVTLEQLRRLFKRLPGHASHTFAYALHLKGKLEPPLAKPLDAEAFEVLFREAKQIARSTRRIDLARKARRRRNYLVLNAGYSEPEEIFEAEDDEHGRPFTEAWRKKSIVEDWWKAEYHHHLHDYVRQIMPEDAEGVKKDRLRDVMRAAVRDHIQEQDSPVLTHEFADFWANPYMNKRSALERILQEQCVRNKLDERVMPRLLDRLPALVQLRSRAPLPPEVLEPLAAFRGDTSWNFDPRERLAQKVGAAKSALEAVEGSEGDVRSVLAALPENAATSADQVPGLYHPWQNHLGFKSEVPTGKAGGSAFGRPATTLQAQLNRLRYPTLQRVAHTLPKDPKWRAQVVQAIRVLERSKNWDFQSKLRAVNTMKEIYDSLKPSEYYTERLDEKLPVNRVASHLKRRYAADADYVKTFPKKWHKKKSMTQYHRSLTKPRPHKKK